ncbi:UNVERIFIED_CONTAM: hypothetical protein PYX00_002557 [Menopon gallinae]|uniref:Choline/ethanolamine kinase n=1 Tax=Menopon gallinae TaxID=328185 RepID=A0AAW2II58_9NEOP
MSGTGEKSAVDRAGMPEAQDSDGIRDKAYELCKEYLNGAWRTITRNQLVVRQVSGGLSNLLYYCALPEGQLPVNNEPSKVLLRIYGQTHGEKVLEMKCVTECVIFTLLSESNRGPRLYGIFPGGRLEEYIPARPLTTEELSDDDVSLLIADAVAQIHSMQVPISKEPRWLWDTIERWLRDMENHMRAGEISPNKLALIEDIINRDLKQELRWLRNYLSSVHSPVVFCHNDLQEGNILMKENVSDNTNHLTVIDFEYCAYNYRGFDLANHFCESMYDYKNENFPYFWARPENYPSPEKQERFVRRYLSSLEGGNCSDEEVKKVLGEIRAYTLASHMFWGIWSVINSIISNISFDYWRYGEARFTAYFQHKSAILRDEETELLLDDPLLTKTDTEDCLQLSTSSRSSSLIETN